MNATEAALRTKTSKKCSSIVRRSTPTYFATQFRVGIIRLAPLKNNGQFSGQPMTSCCLGPCVESPLIAPSSKKANMILSKHYIFFLFSHTSLVFSKLPLHFSKEIRPSERLPPGPLFFNPEGTCDTPFKKVKLNSMPPE